MLSIPSATHAQTVPGARQAALGILLRVRKDGSYVSLSLGQLDRLGLEGPEKNLCTRLVYGVIEKTVTLDYYLSVLSSQPLGQLDADVLESLRLGLYQLMFMDKIPVHAALNETVSLVSIRKRGYVNAVLRSYLRRRSELLPPNRDKDFAAHLSVLSSTPEKLVRKIIDILGRDGAKAFLLTEDRYPLTLRVNTLKISREECLKKLKKAHPDLTFEKTAVSPWGICVSGGNPAELSGFEEGLFFVQDEASQICTTMIGARPGMKILDACACPGSKSFGMAIDSGDKADIRSLDLHPNKISLIREGASRLGLTSVHEGVHDARKVPDASLKDSDIVLCDVPCSGYGVIFKKPEIKYKDPDSCQELPRVQYEILSASSDCVKPGGELIYSTCTILPEENEGVVRQFLDAHPEFGLEPFRVGSLEAPEGMLTLYPHIHGTDGFFMAKLRRRNLA